MGAESATLEYLSALPLGLYLVALSMIGWGYLLGGRGDFWRANQRLSEGAFEAESCPPVAVVVPARDEGDVIRAAVTSIAAQDYAGSVTIFVVDDRSGDRTPTEAAAVDGVVVIAGSERPDGWTGKMWAVSQGLAAVGQQAPDAEFVWLTDADVEHHPGELTSLVAMAGHRSLDLVSLMVRLRIETFWDRLLIPAFVFFFQKLYPFSWVNDPAKKTAAAAGGSMLVRRAALDRIGGIEPIRGELIDDCALAARIKGQGGRIWLALAEQTRSLRAYATYPAIRDMVARTAYHQLGYSPLRLAVTVLGMTLLYVVPPGSLVIAAFSGAWTTAAGGFAAWVALGWAYAPTLYRYGRNPWEAFALPLAAILYTLMTLESARRHHAGRGGEWKGRVHRP